VAVVNAPTYTPHGGVLYCDPHGVDGCDLCSEETAKAGLMADMLAALKAFVAAEEEWREAKSGMPAGTWEDDPLDGAYRAAKAVIDKATFIPTATVKEAK
jgi:hypothetical protein